MSVRIRENRGGNWFWLHNAIVDDYAARLGPYAVAVYLNLCRHVGQDQETFVGQKTIAREMGMSERQVRREVAALVEAALIGVEERIEDTGQKTNIYTLLAVRPPVGQSGGEDSQATAPGQPVHDAPETLIAKNKTHEQGFAGRQHGTRPTSTRTIQRNGRHTAEDYLRDKHVAGWQDLLANEQE